MGGRSRHCLVHTKNKQAGVARTATTLRGRGGVDHGVATRDRSSSLSSSNLSNCIM